MTLLFAIHRLYKERMTQVELKLKEVRLGFAAEYQQPLEELQENMRIRGEVAGEHGRLVSS